MATVKIDLQSYPEKKFYQAWNPPKGAGETISQCDRSAMKRSSILSLTMFLGAVAGYHLEREPIAQDQTI